MYIYFIYILYFIMLSISNNDDLIQAQENISLLKENLTTATAYNKEVQTKVIDLLNTLSDVNADTPISAIAPTFNELSDILSTENIYPQHPARERNPQQYPKIKEGMQNVWNLIGG